MLKGHTMTLEYIQPKILPFAVNIEETYLGSTLLNKTTNFSSHTKDKIIRLLRCLRLTLTCNKKGNPSAFPFLLIKGDTMVFPPKITQYSL